MTLALNLERDHFFHTLKGVTEYVAMDTNGYSGTKGTCGHLRGQSASLGCLGLTGIVPLAAVLLGDDEEGRLCVRKTPGAMGCEARPAWAPVKAPATVYSWSARLLLCASGGISGELPSCEAWLLAVLVEAVLVEAGVVEDGVVEAEVVLAEVVLAEVVEAEVVLAEVVLAEAEVEVVLGASFLLEFFFFPLFCSSFEQTMWQVSQQGQSGLRRWADRAENSPHKLGSRAGRSPCTRPLQ